MAKLLDFVQNHVVVNQNSGCHQVVQIINFDFTEEIPSVD